MAQYAALEKQGWRKHSDVEVARRRMQRIWLKRRGYQPPPGEDLERLKREFLKEKNVTRCPDGWAAGAHKITTGN